MTTFVNPNRLSDPLDAIRTNCNRVWLLSTYTAGDSYATCSGNKVAEITISSANFTVGSSGNNRTLTFTRPAGPDDTANATANVPDGTNLHLAFVDTANSVVELVTEETSDQAVVSGNPIQFPTGIVYTMPQPTGV